MHTTPPTLLEKLREADQPAAWGRFVDLYTPLLLTWGRRVGLQAADAADLVQEVFTVLVRELPKFRYDPEKQNFRGWLRTVCLNKWRDQQRKRGGREPNAQEADLAALEGRDGLESFWNEEHNAHLVRQALQILEELKTEFEPQTVAVCWEVVVNRRPVAEVAGQFNITPNAVYIAKLRVLGRLRQELAEFLE
jgi:RNA polymerase sigma-70 factor (ECF subfamily)